MIDQSRKSRRMRVRFRDGGPPIGGTRAWDASGWLTPRLDLPNFLSDRRIHHGDHADTERHGWLRLRVVLHRLTLLVLSLRHSRPAHDAGLFARCARST